MNQLNLIIIYGQPGSGKTTLGRAIAEKFSLPFISKDELQEKIFDHLGTKDRQWTIKTTLTALDQLYYIIESLLKASKSLVVESNFIFDKDGRRFQELERRYGFKSIQILLEADKEVLIQRIKVRSTSEERHYGHQDIDHLEEYQPRFERGYYQRMDLRGELIKLDTTDFEKVDWDDLYSKIQKTVNE